MKKIIVIVAFSILIIGNGCRKGFLDINNNPNDATVSKPELVLSTALVNTAGRVSNPVGQFSFISGWMGYIAISSGFALNTNDFTSYGETSGFGENIWQNEYDNITDYDYVSTSSQQSGKAYYQAISMIMKAYNYQILVDLFNDIPYSEAIKGTAILHPKYDAAAQIYGDLFHQVDTAMIIMKNAISLPDPKADLMFARKFGFNENPLTPAHFATAKVLWLQFANTFKLRMLERLSEMSAKPSYFATELAIVANDPNGFLTVDASVNPGYLNSAGKQNPFFAANYAVSGTYTQDFWVANSFAIAFYQNHSDPRISRVYTTSGGTYVGNSLGIGGVPGNQSGFGPGILASVSQDAVVMLASESYFIQAEAAARGWISGSVASLFNQGITESFRYLGVPSFSTAATAYYSRAGDTLTNITTRGTVQQKIHAIIAQKWIAENCINVFEPYCDYRRFINAGTTYPGTTTIQRPLGFITVGGPPYGLSRNPNADPQGIPYRIVYPTSETNTNAANVPQGVSARSKIFWMP